MQDRGQVSLPPSGKPTAEQLVNCIGPSTSDNRLAESRYGELATCMVANDVPGSR